MTEQNQIINLDGVELDIARAEMHEAMMSGSIMECFKARRDLENVAHHTSDVFTHKKTKKFDWCFWNRNRIHIEATGMHIFLNCLDRKRTLWVESTQTMEQICALYSIPEWDCWFSYNGKPLRMDVSLQDYGISHNATIVQNIRMRGGSTTSYRVYTHVKECEKQVLAEVPKFSLQSEEITPNENSIDSDLMSKLMESVKAITAHVPQEYDWLAQLLENFFQVAYWARKCDNEADFVTLTMLAYKLLTGKSATVSLWHLFKGDNLQGDVFSNLTRDARDIFRVAENVIDNPITKRFKQIYTYLLVQGFLSKVGKEMEIEEFLKLEKKVKVKSHTHVILLVIDTAIMICERLDAYRLTGDWHALLHEEATYTKWIKDAERLINLSPFTSNLEAQGTTYFQFVSDLNDAIERGEAISKYSMKNNGSESTLMRKRLNTLQLLKNTEITRRSSQKERKAPFGVSLYGGSSVGKSGFTKMLFYYYGKLHGLGTEDHFRYVRNPADQYWTNFTSSAWCVQLDDVAFLLPSKTSEVDPTLMEIICLVNNVPYVPPQAALEDKGKTPVMADLVIATSNAPDLNAGEYFYCPLAVRRRLPYVVNIKPKQEYLADNGKFLDPKKLPKCDNEFPDFWNIEVQKLVPTEHNGRDSATLETVKVFSDIKLFLKHFGEASLKHKETQNASEACDNVMRDLKVCRLCCEIGSDCNCLQSHVYSSITRLVLTYLTTCIVHVLSQITLTFMCTTVCMYLMRFFIYRRAMAAWTSYLNKGVEIKFFGIANGLHEMKYKVCVKHLISATAIFSQFYLMYAAGKYVWNCTKNTPKEEKRQSKQSEPVKVTIVENVSTSTDDICFKHELQGNVFGTTEAQLEKEESNNVWYNPVIELSSFDVPDASASLRNHSPSEVRDLFSHNCVKIEIVAQDVRFATRMCAVYVKGQTLLFNRHAVRLGSRFKMTIYSSVATPGVNPNVTVFFDRSELSELPERDLVSLCVRNAPPRKDITKYWNNTNIPCTRMLAVRRTRGGVVESSDIFNVQFLRNFSVEALNTRMPMYFGSYDDETKDGDCGTLGIALTPQGPIVLGLHTIGYNTTAGFPHVTRDEILSLCSTDIGVNGVGAPKLSLNGENVLLPPHHKSVIRYIESGTANVYGSLPGFRAKPRSRVCSTPLQEEMVEHFKCEINHGPPVMGGWEPVFNNVVEMVNPNTDINQAQLDHCVQSFAKDIIDGLTREHGEAWKAQLVTLSRRASINGLPGVKFIDRINVNSSMGHPWSKTKKQFLVPDASELYPDGVDFTDEVWQRVSEIEEKYARGERAYPVFTGHLKDEALPFKKINAKKTRMFTGAPIDWSLVVRSKLLSFVRLLQKNKFIFEAAPGTVTQSEEWTDFYNYLTYFGKGKIVAGDYSKFDKHMIAAFVLAAFEVIKIIHRTAGFTEEEIRAIGCIGMDTAFPLCNIEGLLMEMYGTNPSGHPLTVIINSIVNSLYMRYSYCSLNPKESTCTDFKKFVHLITYGDDNTMGVSDAIPWFYHGAIQEALREIGVGYTMADKDAETRPYIHIDECSFLKRKWRFEEELGMYACPLEEASIHRSLTVWTPSKTIDNFCQMVAVISAANSEYFHYGRAVFEEHHKFFKQILEREPYSKYVSESTLPGWDDLIVRFRKASETKVSTD